jgi:hypothetical protein
MTVHCEGDCAVIEQLGEKQDFEAHLSRFGFRHEHFVLRVVQPHRPYSRQDYTVTVENVVVERQRAYQGGPAKERVQDCVRDLSSGFFGGPIRR